LECEQSSTLAVKRVPIFYKKLKSNKNMNKSNSKIILYISMSVDGFIAKKNGSVDFLDSYNESGEDCGYKSDPFYFLF